MPRFRYKAVAAGGKPISGEMEAADVKQVTARLQGDGATVEFVGLAGESAADEAGRGGRRIEKMRAGDFRKLSGQLGDLTAAGLPLVQGLSALAAELPSSRFRRGLRSVVDHLQAGGDLAPVLAEHGAPPDLQALITAGVKSGHAGELLGRYAAQSRQVADIKLRVAMALAYPLILLVLMSLLFVAVLAWIVPMFRKIFEDFGTELPGITTLLLSLSHLVVEYGLWLLAGGIVLASVIWVVAAFVLDKITRRQIACAVPVVGRMLRYGALARFSHLLAILVENGIPLPEALALAGESADDAEIRAATWLIAADVEAGEPLDRAAYNMPAMPATLIEAMKWHKQPDVFADALRALADLFEAQARGQTGVFVALAQPIMVLAVGVSVGFTVSALFMPLIKLLNDLS